jgi:hypothetical protein
MDKILFLLAKLFGNIDTKLGTSSAIGKGGGGTKNYPAIPM